MERAGFMAGFLGEISVSGVGGVAKLPPLYPPVKRLSKRITAVFTRFISVGISVGRSRC